MKVKCVDIFVIWIFTRQWGWITFLQASLSSMAGLLTKLIHKSIRSHTFPDVWKNAVEIPVQKSNQSSSLFNFRPISILLVFSKILESDQVVYHFNRHYCTYFQTNSLAFVLVIITQDVLLHVNDSWLCAFDTGQYVDAVFFWTWLRPFKGLCESWYSFTKIGVLLY